MNVNRRRSARSLPHRLVVFTGPLASGKTTLRDTLVLLLGRLGHKVHIVDNLADLYAPLAERMGLPIVPGMSRDEVTSIIAKVYAEHGREVGTSLLLDYLARSSAEPIYVVDGKRNPDGLRALRAAVTRAAIIGVYAPAKLRLSRALSRGKAMDAGLDVERTIRREDDLFDTQAALAEADVVIENDSATPFRVEMMLLEALQQARVIARFAVPYLPVQPARKAESPPRIPPLTRVDYRLALDDFVARVSSHNVVVVQGGNRYATHYLRERHQVDLIELKLSSLSKQHPSVLFATALTPLERSRSLDCNETTLADLLATLPPPALPFARHTRNDRHVRSDFAALQDLIGTPCPLDQREVAVQEALHGTRLFQRLAEGGRPIALLDDILYRGRTLHAAWYVLRILGLVDRPWRLFTLCADRVSQTLTSPFIHVLRRGYGYPFENSAQSAQGYYDLVNGRFEYRDLSQLRPTVAALWPEVEARSPLDADWNTLLSHAVKVLSPPPGLRAIARAIATIVAHRWAFNGAAQVDANSLADQRATGLGWCPAFLSFWDAFISQEQPVSQREAFKDRVRQMCMQADEAVGSSSFGDLVDLHREIYPRIWYQNDCLI